ncbi:MAG: 1-deoxy-D-xylulose-5-phosphate reductoisomerase [Desulfobacteraceae bacterium]|nr:1-deoxy-D-xylulose-5-phosphate reductoisomerase [Desulfobacteraceae bacterium]
MKYLSILGSTGSIGRNALSVVKQFPDQFKVVALTAKHSVERLSEQIRMFRPEMAVVFDEQAAGRLEKLMGGGPAIKIRYGPQGYNAAVVHAKVEMVLSAMVGAAGLVPTLAAIEAGKDIALANKETLVMAGNLVMAAAQRHNVRIVPVDSEHSAIFQSMIGHRRRDIDKILLTASGGPFLRRPADTFGDIKPEDALDHPNWEMGKKISIDSSTLMNKGLEIIEARWLFDIPVDQIEVVIHPQSIVHSMVAYRDGSIMAQMGIPDMKGAIAYGLSYPERLPLGQPLPAFNRIGALTFEPPDIKRFPCLQLAFDACGAGGTMPAVLNAANEVAVQALLDRKIHYTDIYHLVKGAMAQHEIVENPGLDAILKADTWARMKTLSNPRPNCANQ